MDVSKRIRSYSIFTRYLGWLAICLSTTGLISAQDLTLDPRNCGYSCSAKDVILSQPYLAADLNGTRIESCNGDSDELLTAYIALTLENTTGSNRYTPMITATLNVGGIRSTISGCFPEMAPQESAIRVLPLEFQFACGTEIFLEEVWIGWNVTAKTCDQLQSETQCNRLIPSGKCGDYNSIPTYLKIPVETPAVLGQENTGSRCGDGIDNDGNGLIDCDDFDCVNFETCDYTATSSGIDGGLESNNRLLENIAQRQYKRSTDRQTIQKINRPENNIIKGFTNTYRAAKNDGLPLMEEVIPLDILPEAIPYMSTPEDLPELTNATRSLSIDFYTGNQPVAAILGTRTQNAVYEHTKVVCDRVGETRLSNIWAIALDGENPMLINKLEHKDGTVEYSCSFSARLDQVKTLIIENHWNVYEYPQADNYINFQVWAANTKMLQLLVTGIINKLGTTTASIPVHRTGDVPAAYIHQTTYRNHTLELEIANPSGEKNLRVAGVLQRVEGGMEENFEWNIALSGSITEILEIDTKAVYSLGLTLWGNSEGPADTIFFADGIWAMDLDPSKENAQFMVFQDFQSKNDEDWFIERGVQISGQMNEKYAWYRSLNNTFKGVSLNEYKALTFETESNNAYEMEVVLAHAGYPWENQLRKKVVVKPGKQVHTLLFDSFKGEKTQLESISMVVFVLENKKEYAQEVRLELQKMRFSRQQLKEDARNIYKAQQESSLRIFPNPLSAKSEIGFYSPREGKALWNLSSTGGQIIRSGKISVIQGTNQHPFYQEKLSSGVYFMEVQLPNAEKLQTTVIVP